MDMVLIIMRMLQVVLILISSFALELVSAQQPHPVIHINYENIQTKIIGTQHVTWKGETFYAFRGIPYAKPPVGFLRFKDPQVIDELPGVIDARYDGHDCPSIYATNASENCLILNVYTKNLNLSNPVPVIAFIHPGGLYVGSSLSSFIGPEYLLSKNVILVTFNYRLGTLGYSNLNSREIPGNAGFKDQVLALRWIKKHIHKFGGNGDVTLMGYSAGGMSTVAHLASPMSAGLFHKIISMSGSVPPLAYPLSNDKHQQLALRQVKLLNCPLNELVMDCFTRHSGSEIAATLRGMFEFGKDNPMYPWLPVSEQDFGQEQFLNESIFHIFEEGRFQHVPLLLGFTNGEFCTSAADIIKSSELEPRFYEEFSQLAPKIFMYENQANMENITQAIKNHYLANSTAGSTDLLQLCKLFSDAIIRFGDHRLSQLASKHAKVFNYKFSYRGEHTNLNYNLKDSPVEHLDDLMYLFRMDPHHFEANDPEAQIVEMYTSFIYDFVVNGHKFYDENNLIFPHKYFEIGEKVEIREGINFDEAEFWNNLIP